MKVLLFILATASLGLAAPSTRAPLDEYFGYVDVRPGAHMFWVTYQVDQLDAWTNYPLIMWLQGGPGSSGVGYGNFEELGPYYINQSLRETAWTKKANLMFVDNPVGTGYSYVDDFSLLTTNNTQIADDLVTLLKSVFTDYPDMSVMPFFVYAESYGGKMTVDFALALDAAINRGEIACNFHGVALGDSWISPMDSVNTWGTFLYNMGFVDAAGQANIDAAAATTQAAVDAEDWVTATDEWGNTEGVVIVNANNVNFYNVLAKENIYRSELGLKKSKSLDYMRPEVRGLYERHVMPFTTRDALNDLMNGPYKTRWNIPETVVWDSQGGQVFNTLEGDFMKPVVDSVVQLLETTNVYVAVFTGDLDLICDTPGTYRWIENMNYVDKPTWEGTRRQNFFVSTYSTKAGYVQNYQNFGVFTILRSGHMVPTDAPIESLVMIDMITDFANANQQLVKERHQRSEQAAITIKQVEKEMALDNAKEHLKPAEKKVLKTVLEAPETKLKVQEVKEKIHAAKVEQKKDEVKAKVQAAKVEQKKEVIKDKVQAAKVEQKKEEIKAKVQAVKVEQKKEEIKEKVHAVKVEQKKEEIKEKVHAVKVEEKKEEIKAKAAEIVEEKKEVNKVAKVNQVKKQVNNVKQSQDLKKLKAPSFKKAYAAARSLVHKANKK